MKKTLLVGLHNPLSARPADALYPYPANSTGARIVRLIQEVEPSFDDVAYLMAFDRMNLWRLRALPVGRGAAAAFKAEADVVVRAIEGRDNVVLFGARVWHTVIGSPVPAAFESELLRHVAGPRCWYFPHPSGRNRFYNNRGQRERAGQILLNLARRTP